MAKCPHCEEVISKLHLEELTASIPFGREWKTIAYSCPKCQKIINAQIDPIAIRTDIIAEIKNNKK